MNWPIEKYPLIHQVISHPICSPIVCIIVEKVKIENYWIKIKLSQVLIYFKYMQ